MKNIINLRKSFENVSKEKVIKNLQILFAATLAAFMVHGLVSLYVYEKSFTHGFTAFAANWAILAFAIIFFKINVPKVFRFKGKEQGNGEYNVLLALMVIVTMFLIFVLAYDIDLPGHKAQLFIFKYGREFIFLSYVISMLLLRLQGSILVLGIVTMIVYVVYGNIAVLSLTGLIGIAAGQVVRLIFMTDWSSALSKGQK